MPVKPKYALDKYSQFLTEYEREEIKKYQDIFWIGIGCKKRKATLANTKDGKVDNNHNFDNERSDYLWQENDHIAYRYKMLDCLGKGSFGWVIRVFDFKKKTFCALKIIRSQNKFYNQGLIEVKILKHIRTNDPNDRSCCIRIRNFLLFRKHICLVFDLLSINLFQFMKL